MKTKAKNTGFASHFDKVSAKIDSCVEMLRTICKLPDKCGKFYVTCAMKNTAQMLRKKQHGLEPTEIVEAFKYLEQKTANLEKLIEANVSQAFIEKRKGLKNVTRTSSCKLVHSFLPYGVDKEPAESGLHLPTESCLPSSILLADSSERS